MVLRHGALTQQPGGSGRRFDLRQIDELFDRCGCSTERDQRLALESFPDDHLVERAAEGGRWVAQRLEHRGAVVRNEHVIEDEVTRSGAAHSAGKPRVNDAHI